MILDRVFASLLLAATLQWNSSSLAQSDVAIATKTYRNPIIDLIGPADPAVILHEGTYYLYPTLDGKGYDVFTSNDLVNWTP